MNAEQAFKFLYEVRYLTLAPKVLITPPVRWQRRVVALLYLPAERVEVHLVSVEGRLQGCHLVKQAAKGPDVRLEVVAVK